MGVESMDRNDHPGKAVLLEEEKQDQLEFFIEEREHLRTLLLSRDEECNIYRDKLRASWEDLANRAEEIKQLEQDKSELRSSVQKKKEETELLKQEIAKVKASAESKEAELRKKTKELQLLQEQVEDLQKLVAFRDQEIAGFSQRYRQLKMDLNKLMIFMEKVEEGVNILLESKRWKMGNFLGNLQSKLLFKAEVTMPAQYIRGVLDQYAGWKKRYKEQAEG